MKRNQDNSIEIISYPETFEGIILSFADRYPFNKDMYHEMLSIWDEHKSTIRV